MASGTVRALHNGTLCADATSCTNSGAGADRRALLPRDELLYSWAHSLILGAERRAGGVWLPAQPRAEREWSHSSVFRAPALRVASREPGALRCAAGPAWRRGAGQKRLRLADTADFAWPCGRLSLVPRDTAQCL